MRGMEAHERSKSIHVVLSMHVHVLMERDREREIYQSS
jgi:hypothetical protein